MKKTNVTQKEVINLKQQVKINQVIPKQKNTMYVSKEISKFLDSCLGSVTAEDATNYIEWKLGLLSTSINLSPKESGYQIKPALSEMLDKKVRRNSIIDLVRVVQSDILFDTFLKIEQTYEKKGNWGFYIEDPTGCPIYKVKQDELSAVFEKDEFLPREIKKSLKKPLTNQ